MLVKIKENTYIDFSKIVNIRVDIDGDLEVKMYFEGFSNLCTLCIQKNDIQIFINKLESFWNIS